MIATSAVIAAAGRAPARGRCRVRARAAMLVVALGAACGGRTGSGEASFAVARVRPGPGTEVFLNQPIAVYFNEPVDALSVTPDTVRVVDEEGHAVAMQRLEVGSQVVTLHPRPPVLAALDDGSFGPGRRYCLEVAGYPQVNAVRSRSGRTLAAGLRQHFTVVSLSGNEEYPRPLLPVGVGDEAFTLDPARRLEVQAGTGVLHLHFTLPPYPPSVQPEAFVVQRLVGPAAGRATVEVQSVPVKAARVVRDPSDPFPASTVALELDATPPIGIHDHLALFLVDGEAGVVDYAGRPLTPFGGSEVAARLPSGYAMVCEVKVRAGPALEIARISAADGVGLEAADLGRPGFEARDRVRFVPRVRLAAGSGVHGVLRPEASMRLGPSEALTFSAGRVVHAGATLELAGLEIPAGVRLTLGGFDHPVQILVTGSVRIAGELVLETPRAPLDDADGVAAAWPIRDAELGTLAGCVVVAAGDIEVSGRIEHVQEGTPMGPALALVAGGRIALHGRVPPRTVCGAEGGVVGDLQAAHVRPVRLRPGYAGVAPVTAIACTPWVRVPAWVQGPLAGTAIGAEPGVEVLWQAAPPHALDAQRPDPRPETWSQARALVPDDPIPANPGYFVRFQLRARLTPGQLRLPGLTDLVLGAQTAR
ncbi:MAG TPA: Ig-like domain-containing protein [Planctomycetota bacterium]|nr:Ig-like domain-containing protein [Planctomycetota bacterium]